MVQTAKIQKTRRTDGIPYFELFSIRHAIKIVIR